MKVAPSNLSPPTRRMPIRKKQQQLSLVKANLVCLPVSTRDEPKPPTFCQLFQSLDNNNNNNSNPGEAFPLSPLPLRLSVNPKEFTPPPSPFGYSKTTILNKNGKNYAGITNNDCTFPKTPSSVRTAETESIASLSSYGGSTPNSSTATTPRSSPLPTTRPMARSRIPSLGFAPCFYQGCHPSSPSESSSVHYPTPPKPFPSITKPKKKNQSLSSHDSNRNPSRVGTSSPSAKDHNGSSKSRLQKVKTELCLYYMSDGTCPYGANCHYAHGEHELQTKRLLTLQNLGHIEDASTYRIKPCFSHVAVGSCPFGKRCACIHDPRVTGTVQSWLPITETQGNSIMTDINVEGLYQKRRFDILFGDPFVREHHHQENNESYHDWNGHYNTISNDWSDLYNTIANINDYPKKSHNRRSGKRKHHIKEVHKVAIALQMHGETHRWMYKYRPSHTIFNELCMVLDKRAFRLDEDRAIPLSISKYRPGNPTHCIVREIAFGPDGDLSVRPVTLWFNIPGDRMTECTPHKQKLFRWHKNKQLQPKHTSNNNMDGFQVVSSSPFDSHVSFKMIRPIEREAFSLVKSTLEHRYASLRAENITSIRERSSTLETLAREHSILGERFSNLRRHWTSWAYPSASGRPPIDERTPVPPSDAKYEPGEADPTNPCFRESRKLWASFLSTLEALKMEDDIQIHVPKTILTGSSYLVGDFCPVAETEARPTHKRLSIFEKLSHGEAMDHGNRSLPHITHGPSYSSEKPRQAKPKESYSRQSERCWKSLFLEHDGIQEAEWDAVVDHFTNSSRSQKVLNIVQHT